MRLRCHTKTAECLSKHRAVCQQYCFAMKEEGGGSDVAGARLWLEDRAAAVAIIYASEREIYLQLTRRYPVLSCMASAAPTGIKI